VLTPLAFLNLAIGAVEVVTTKALFQP